MKTNIRIPSSPSRRWTGRLAVSLSCLAVVGCGGGDGGDTAAPEMAAAPAPTELLAVQTQVARSTAIQTVSGSGAALQSVERYNRVVYQMYLAYFGRPPDPVSLAEHASKLSTLGQQPTLTAIIAQYKTNAKLREMLDGFANNAESKTMFSGTTAQFVTKVYKTILGRNIDAASLNYWNGLISTGKIPRSVAALSILNAAVTAADAGVIEKKLDAASKFTTTIQELQLTTAYATPQAIDAGRNLLGGITAATNPTSVSTSVNNSIALLSPPKRPDPVVTIPPDALTDLRLENTNLLPQTNVPFTFGQPFVQGQLKATDRLIGRLTNGSTVALQMDVKATHADGSVRHAIISGVVPALGPFEKKKIELLKANAAGSGAASTTNSVPANFSSRVDIKLDGITYTADLADAVAAGKAIKWLSGPIANESLYSVPFKSTSGNKHPHLAARFDVRSYPQLDNQVRVDVVIENTPTFTAGQRNYTYDADVLVNGRSVYKQNKLTHYHHARWHKAIWSNSSGTSPVHVMHNTGYLIATKAISNYDQSVTPKESALSGFAMLLTPDRSGPMKIGPLNPYMPSTGGRPDIGPLPSWAVSYLLSMDRRARDSMMAIADGSGSWSIHYRDEKTGYPVRLDNEVNKNISTHMNLANKGPLPVPRCADDNADLCKTPYSHDTSHQPSFAYLPYLLTGDYFYLEELQFWASWNPTQTDPKNHGLGQGLVHWQQVRAQAWSLRTLGHAAYVTPDNHFLKSYFAKMLDNNLDWYHQTYVIGNPNALGMYDGSGKGAFQVNGSAPWQDDFLTWSFGYLTELGFTKAKPILRWKAQYPVGRMTAPGYCWTDGADYFLKNRESPNSPIYGSFAALYAANFQEDLMTDDNSKPISHPKGLRYLDQPCGSQAQADWRAAAGRAGWSKGQMSGYASSEMGYPSNMQPALAVATASGVPNAAAAWSTFMSRSVKPDYSKGPQFAIIPR